MKIAEVSTWIGKAVPIQAPNAKWQGATYGILASALRFRRKSYGYGVVADDKGTLLSFFGARIDNGEVVRVSETVAYAPASHFITRDAVEHWQECQDAAVRRREYQQAERERKADQRVSSNDRIEQLDRLVPGLGLYADSNGTVTLSSDKFASIVDALALVCAELA